MIMEFPWNFHGFSMEFPKWFSQISLFFYRISMEFLWNFYGISTFLDYLCLDNPWKFHGISIVFFRNLIEFLKSEFKLVRKSNAPR